MNASPIADALFLEPPHSHDPSNVSHVAALPASMLMQLPEAVQDALWTLQESTSIVYASYLRLQELLDERFDRLIPLPGMPGSYSEGAFFNYMNALSAERRYLLEDAHPDWKHKASRAGLSQYGELLLTCRGKEMTVREWFEQLQRAEQLWIQEAKDAELPDFESTVTEYQILTDSESSTPPSEVSEDEGPRGWDARPGPATRKPMADLRTKMGGGHEIGPERIAKALEAL
ncbi:uncharacterized protein Z519_00338 [Cladophialophora bantiana CBS 173.52]|uniref:Uncharacterized protein n=1 Tax=Cladophialophora bantiana (strain ATCC 10958 / CBS 173.52 / CDC B-1940 / NIH 8579) TaxID=1442370 RepID=A0A0D2GJT5_CLAB1|nr:uncharacterized protein Z519_00338 [Cladophialophora bantiana CBS 173.52]KIW98677.1 hypothetical protein Z519_00338 [Cladophialophora bantiana CBS 173.52]